MEGKLTQPHAIWCKKPWLPTPFDLSPRSVATNSLPRWSKSRSGMLEEGQMDGDFFKPKHVVDRQSAVFGMDGFVSRVCIIMCETYESNNKCISHSSVHTYTHYPTAALLLWYFVFNLRCAYTAPSVDWWESETYFYNNRKNDSWPNEQSFSKG